MVQDSTKLFYFKMLLSLSVQFTFFVFDAAPIVSHVKTKQVDYTTRTLPAFRFEEKKGRLKTKICFQTTFLLFRQIKFVRQSGQ